MNIFSSLLLIDKEEGEWVLLGILEETVERLARRDTLLTWHLRQHWKRLWIVLDQLQLVPNFILKFGEK
jgi:hypothetical protein